MRTIARQNTPALQAREYHEYSLVFFMISVHTKTQIQRFQIPEFEERFRKASFSWRISVVGRI